VPWRSKQTSEQAPLKLLLWTAIAGLIFGLIGFGEIAEDLLRTTRNKLHSHQASGDIVLVKFDDASLREVGRWPWPRRYLAQITDTVSRGGANRIFFDIILDAPTDAGDDRMLAAAIKRSGRVTLPVMARSGPDQGRRQEILPLPMFSDNAELGAISVVYNWQNAAWQLPYASRVAGQAVPSFAAKLARVQGPVDRFFTPDYSVDPASVPSISAKDVISGRYSAKAFAGKDVVIGVATEAIGDELFIPGTGRMGGAYVQIIGAETLKAGVPRNFGWLPLFVVGLIIAAVAATRRSGAVQVGLLGGAILAFMLVPAVLEANLLVLDITPGLFVILTVAVVLGWRGFRQRGLVNSVSGLSNLSALRSDRSGRAQALIAARVFNFEDVVATLPPEGERQLVDQIVSRLKVGAPDRHIYHGDGGLFAWFADGRSPFANHIEALHAMFRNPAKLAGMSIDLTITFGVEIGSSRSLGNRLASAIVAAEDAARDGLKWKYHDPETLADASWRLSMLSQLDDAVDKGEVWVAYQPKLDLATRRIIGAEALARWTHPEKGPIAASEFVAAAEQSDRIGKLTDFVLDQAIAAAAQVNRKHPGFGVAVNLSARLLSDRGFVLRLGAKLARLGLAPERLTLELTETAALAGTGAEIEMITALRDLGVTISIDDYGTGLSTLDYLKRIPASEIKIDQSFVKGLADNRSDRLMVQSTISLAHSLGRKVVAEGVERRDVLDALVEMDCDIAQGFIIGRPMSLESLVKRLTSARTSHVA
jgi:EAL domain-containing protein (putative c-di-GMP-specific phosphodiesterase class I)/CHASE2 domain-containing sensor protein